jgi:hypothetical protein
LKDQQIQMGVEIGLLHLLLFQQQWIVRSFKAGRRGGVLEGPWQQLVCARK